QFHPDVNRWDGFIVSVNDKTVHDVDNQLKAYRLSFRVDAAGAADPEDDLPALITNGTASLALALKPGTTVDTLGTNVDAGYTAELRLDLTALGYPPGLGDHLGYIGVDHLDGDSFLPVTDSYGTRTWWFREYPGDCCPAIAYFAPLTAVDVPIIASTHSGPAFARTLASPSSKPAIELFVPEWNRITLDLYDVSGRLVESHKMGMVGPGVQRIELDGTAMASGVYLYMVKLVDPSSGALRDTLHGKAVLVK
ncbi:MAG TPA: hypothetical protein VFR10_08540, partial [bacterium]|nr:hypothetical protein [bacterium]